MLSAREMVSRSNMWTDIIGGRRFSIARVGFQLLLISLTVFISLIQAKYCSVHYITITKYLVINDFFPFFSFLNIITLIIGCSRKDDELYCVIKMIQ